MLKFILASISVHFLILTPFILKSNGFVKELSVQSGAPLEIQLINRSHKKTFSKKSSVKKKYPALSDTNKVSESYIDKSEQEGVMQERHMTGALKPVYPLSSRRLGEEGTAKIKITIDASGNIINYLLVSSSGYKRLDKAAIKATEEVKFKPLKNKYSKATSSQELVFDFQLKKL